MIAGLVLSDTTDRESRLAFIGDDTKTYSVETNQEIIELVQEHGPDILAVDVDETEGPEEMTKDEKEAQEEGYNFTPNAHQSMKQKRFRALKELLFREMGAEQPDLIRFDPHITAEELAIEGDSALESYGVATENIEHSGEFDAVLGAVTARFFEQGSFTDMGIIIPEPVKDNT
jgi:hypothetical protein